MLVFKIKINSQVYPLIFKSMSFTISERPIECSQPQSFRALESSKTLWYQQITRKEREKEKTK